MATSYPGAIDSYDTKVNKSDIYDASHVNDLQDAVVAVQTSLQAGTAAPSTPTAKTLYEDSIIKVWVRFNYSGATLVLEDDVNVSSVDDDDTGNLGVNFATAMSDNAYGISAIRAGSAGLVYSDSRTNSAIELISVNTSATPQDEGGAVIIVGNN